MRASPEEMVEDAVENPHFTGGSVQSTRVEKKDSEDCHSLQEPELYLPLSPWTLQLQLGPCTLKLVLQLLGLLGAQPWSGRSVLSCFGAEIFQLGLSKATGTSGSPAFTASP